MKVSCFVGRCQQLRTLYPHRSRSVAAQHPAQGLLQWPPALQAAALRVVATASHPNAGTPPHPVAWTGQQLSVLATLLVQPHHHLPPTLTCQEDQHQEQSQQQQEQQQLVQQLSYQLLCSALARLCCADWEPALWLGCLARLAQCTHPGDAPGSAGSSSLSASLVQFLVEAVAAAGRRPLAAVEVAAAVGGQLAGGSAAHEAVGLQQVGLCTRSVPVLAKRVAWWECSAILCIAADVAVSALLTLASSSNHVVSSCAVRM